MASPIDIDDILNGVGEFPPITEHTLKSLFQKTDLDQGISTAITNVNNAAWERTINDTLELDGYDISTWETFSENTQNKIKAIVCYMIMHLLWKRSRNHKDDIRNFESKDSLDNYERIRGRLKLFVPQGLYINAGTGGKLVRES